MDVQCTSVSRCNSIRASESEPVLQNEFSNFFVAMHPIQSSTKRTSFGDPVGLCRMRSRNDFHSIARTRHLDHAQLLAHEKARVTGHSRPLGFVQERVDLDHQLGHRHCRIDKVEAGEGCGTSLCRRSAMPPTASESRAASPVARSPEDEISHERRDDLEQRHGPLFGLAGGAGLWINCAPAG